jgi:hypothetical protein
MFDEVPEEETKEDPNDIQVTSVNEKNTILESKKVAISLHRKKLSQNLKKLDSILTHEEAIERSISESLFSAQKSPENKFVFKYSIDQDTMPHYGTPKAGTKNDNYSPFHEASQSITSDAKSVHPVFKKRAGMNPLALHGSISSNTSFAPTPTRMRPDTRTQDEFDYTNKDEESSPSHYYFRGDLASHIDFRGDNKSVV